ncbi:MAG: hypothetical protein AAGN66_05855 [Acidobacteriota bacterium]
MLESVRNRFEALPRVPAHVVLSAGTLTSFTWLLLQDRIHPFVIYMLQVYLTF